MAPGMRSEKWISSPACTGRSSSKSTPLAETLRVRAAISSIAGSQNHRQHKRKTHRATDFLPPHHCYGSCNFRGDIRGDIQILKTNSCFYPDKSS